ncbi:hypothetical protein DFR70_13230 [Nocardia tenerifensis]|uniref:Uncharacterized protein n=2 Tax=Nocardia tenerifensis TaxID=228006 RepID=A0A318K9W5_9NOCA|nr:hypothetical protein DFR70_13230 [Nocardia tenerifensis]
MVQRAAEFAWSWTVDDLTGFAEQVGWRVANLDERSITLMTDFDVNRAGAKVYAEETGKLGASRVLNSIRVYVSDVVMDDPGLVHGLNEAFEEVAQQVFDELGQRPTGWWIKPSRGLRWDLSRIVIEVTTSGGHSVSIKLINPAYQAWRDEIDKNLVQEDQLDLDRVWNFD